MSMPPPPRCLWSYDYCHAWDRVHLSYRVHPPVTEGGGYELVSAGGEKFRLRNFAPQFLRVEKRNFVMAVLRSDAKKGRAGIFHFFFVPNKTQSYDFQVFWQPTPSLTDARNKEKRMKKTSPPFFMIVMKKTTIIFVSQLSKTMAQNWS